MTIAVNLSDDTLGPDTSMEECESGLTQEILRYFEIVRAAQATGQSPPLSAASTLATFDDLMAVLRGFAYDPTSSDCWQALGLSPLEGPEPTLGMLESRARTARLLSSAAEGPRWSQSDKQLVPPFLKKLELAVQDCANSLAGWRRERRKLKPSRLPLWKELGPRALCAVLDTALSPQERVATQWSALLGSGPPRLREQADDRVLPLDGARRLAESAEKGDDSFWDLLQNVPVVIWAPTDSSALGRLREHMLERSSGGSLPQYIRMITPLETFPRCHSVDAIQVDFVTHPMEFVSPGSVGPRQEFKGLAIFTISTYLPKGPPNMLMVEEPLFSLGDKPTYVVDIPAMALPLVYSFMSDPGMRCATMGRITRSPGHTAEVQRITVDIRFDRAIPALEQELRMRRLRSAALPPDSFYGSHAMFSDPAALLAEFAHPGAACKAWSLCSGLIPLTSGKVLVQSETE
ncbi:unnamed protein product, partial [Prorocentrum cordatum]